MDIIVNKVFDTLRFAHFMNVKHNYPLSYMDVIIKTINDYNNPIKFYNLLECEINYLQYFIVANKPICNLKITNMEKSNPYSDKKRTSRIDISSQPSDESKQEPLMLFHVTFTKVIHYDEMLNERQIQALLKDNHVKSINIEK